MPTKKKAKKKRASKPVGYTVQQVLEFQAGAAGPCTCDGGGAKCWVCRCEKILGREGIFPLKHKESKKLPDILPVPYILDPLRYTSLNADEWRKLANLAQRACLIGARTFVLTRHYTKGGSVVSGNEVWAFPARVAYEHYIDMAATPPSVSDTAGWRDQS